MSETWFRLCICLENNRFVTSFHGAVNVHVTTRPRWIGVFDEFCWRRTWTLDPWPPSCLLSSSSVAMASTRRHRHVHVTKCTELPPCDWMIDHWWRRASECSTSCWWFYLHMRPYLYPFLSHVLPRSSHWTLMGFTCSSLPLAFKCDTQMR